MRPLPPHRPARALAVRPFERLAWSLCLAACLAGLAGRAPAAGAGDPGAAAPAAAAAPASAPASSTMREVQVAADAFQRGSAPPDWVEPVAIPAASRTAPFLIRLADTQLRAGEVAAYYVHRALQAGDASTLKRAGEFPISFNPAYQRLALHSIVVHRDGQALDRTATANVRFLQSSAEFSSSVYTSAVVAAVLIEDVRAGDTVEYAYTLFGENPVFGGRYSQFVSWDQGDPTDLRRVEFTAPASRQIAWRGIGDGKARFPAPGRSERDGLVQLVFEEKSLEAILPDPLTPNSYLPGRVLQFSEYGSWAQVGAWAAGLFPPQEPSSPEFGDLVRSLRSLATPEERLSAALAYTQREIRYFSLSFGESSHRPAAPDLVLQRRFGDCKDKTYFLLALLRRLDIDAHPALMSSQRRSRFESLLPTPDFFDHVIVEARIGGRTFDVDGTMFEQKGPIDRIGQVFEGMQVLVADADSGHLATIAQSSEELHTVEQQDRIVMHGFSEAADLVSRQVLTGSRAALFRAALARFDARAMDKELAAEYEKSYPGCTVERPVTIENDEKANRVVITSRVRIPELARKSGQLWIMPFRPKNLAGVMTTPPGTARTLPMQLAAFPYRARYSLQIDLPDDVAFLRDPHTEQVRSRYFDYTEFTTLRGSHGQVDIEFKVLADEVPADRIAEYQSDIDKLGRQAHWAIIVGPDDLRGKAVAGADRKSLRETLVARHRDAIDKYTGSIDSGQLGPQDLAEAHCERASSFYALGEFDKAMADANRAVELAPNDGNQLACRAEVHFAAGRFEQAAADDTKALLLGPQRGRYLRARGQARYFLQQFAEAADDLRRSSESEKDASAQAYIDIWAVAAHLRAGLPVPEPIASRARGGGGGSWPAPVLAMMTGDLAPEAMMKGVEGKSGDERAMIGTEAWYYLGQHYLVAGDRPRAREAFEKARALEVIDFVEYLAAGFELSSAGSPAP